MVSRGRDEVFLAVILNIYLYLTLVNRLIPCRYTNYRILSERQRWCAEPVAKALSDVVAKQLGKEQDLNTTQYMEYDWNLC